MTTFDEKAERATHLAILIYTVGDLLNLLKDEENLRPETRHVSNNLQQIMEEMRKAASSP